jgi:hypothetical protein
MANIYLFLQIVFGKGHVISIVTIKKRLQTRMQFNFLLLDFMLLVYLTI